MPDIEPTDDPWATLRPTTAARIGLRRTGNAPALRHVLDFQFAHARARDAVHAPLDQAALSAALAPLDTVAVRSAAPDRPTFLRRPDLGRRLCEEDRARLHPGNHDLVFVVGDGLSARAAECHAAAVIHAALVRLPSWRIAPVVVATQARVALGDEVGERLGAAMCAVLIGERPGLSVAESLGIYLTFGPRVGRSDAERNCISNIHDRGGLSAEDAAAKLVWLMTEARRLQLTGVGLKDRAPAPALPDPHLGTAPALR